jgi:hypothetical protein
MLAEGAEGDVIAVGGDATLDAGALTDIRVVVRSGRRIV